MANAQLGKRVHHGISVKHELLTLTCKITPKHWCCHFVKWSSQIKQARIKQSTEKHFEYMRRGGTEKRQKLLRMLCSKCNEQMIAWCSRISWFMVTRNALKSFKRKLRNITRGHKLQNAHAVPATSYAICFFPDAFSCLGCFFRASKLLVRMRKHLAGLIFLTITNQRMQFLLLVEISKAYKYALVM